MWTSFLQHEKISMLTKLILLVGLFCSCGGQDLSFYNCSANQNMAEYNNGPDVMLGGLFDMREAGLNGFGCGKPTKDMQIFEATRFALDLVTMYDFMQGISLGFYAYDTCQSASQALHWFQELYPQSGTSSSFCSPKLTVMNPQGDLQQTVIPGIIGLMSSEPAMAVADLAGKMSVSVVSPAVSQPAFSDKVKYPTFLRTMQSQAEQVKAIVELLAKLKWENVLVLYVDSQPNRSLYKEFLTRMFEQNLCVAKAVPIEDGGNTATYAATLTNLGSLANFTATIFLGSGENALSMLQAANTLQSVGNLQWIFSELDTSQDLTNLRSVRGAIVVQLKPFPVIEEFKTYFIDRLLNPQNVNGNPWFKSWYESEYQCSFARNSCPTRTRAELENEFIQSPLVTLAMESVFAYAQTVNTICPNAQGEVCPRLRSMSPAEFHRQLRNINFTIPNDYRISSLRGRRIKFNANGDPESSEFSVYNYNNKGGQFQFEQIGIFSSSLTLTSEPQIFDRNHNNVIATPIADCGTVGCDNCLMPQRRVEFTYSPGDIVISSLVSGHMAGRGPLTCGAGSASGLAALVAAEWAVNTFKSSNPGKLQGVTLGYLAADVCTDSFISDAFLTDLLSGNNRLTDSAGAVIPADNILAFVDHTGSGQTESISSVLSKLRIPEIQAGGLVSDPPTSSIPFTSQAIPTQKVYFTAIASLLQRLGWKYIQVASSLSEGYKEQVEMFRSVAATKGICVYESYLDEGYTSVYQRLATQGWSIVVVLGSVTDLQELIKAQGQTGSNNLQFISGIEDFSRDPQLVQNLGNAAESLIILEPEPRTKTAFHNYLRNLQRSQVVAHPFLRELFEVNNECSLDSSTRFLYTRDCNGQDNFNIYQGKTSYVIDSVFTVAEKLDEVLREVCLDNYVGLCSDFHSNLDIGQKLADKLYNTGRTASGFEIRNGKSMANFNIYYRRQGSYSSIGVFRSDDLLLANQNLAPLGDYSSLVDPCPDGCVQCQYLYTLQDSYYTPGDWLIAGAFRVRDPGPASLQPYVCGVVSSSTGAQATAAMMYAIDQVNNGAAPVRVSGATIGGLALDHCGATGRAGLLMADVHSGLEGDGGFLSLGNDHTQILSWLTDDVGSSQEAINLLQPLDVAVVSPAATSAGLLDYPNFYRTIQGDTTADTAVIKIIKSLGFQYIQVAYSTDESFQTFKAVADQETICITHQVKVMNSSQVMTSVDAMMTSMTSVVVLLTPSPLTTALLQAAVNDPVARGKMMFLTAKPSPIVTGRLNERFRYPVISIQLANSNQRYLDNVSMEKLLENPHFALYYMSVNRCNLPGYSMYNSSCQSIRRLNIAQETVVESTINAVYATVDALDRTIKEFCGTDYQSPCMKFINAPNKRQRFNAHLSQVNFRSESGRVFTFLEREANTVFHIIQNNQMVASYEGATLDLANLQGYDGVVSQCLSPCLECILRNIEFSYTPGDIYLAGIFDVHDRGLSPFSCGEIKTLHGFLLMEAFHYALDQVNDKTGQFSDILSSVRLGGVGLDACSSDVRSGYLVSNINNGLFTLARDGDYITPEKIDSYIGSYDSEASIYLARILKDLEVPQISYGSTSALLNDSRLFPHFFRTVPSDVSQVQAILAFLDRADIRYVQVLYLDDENGHSVKEIFEQEASNYQVCVAQSVSYPDISIVTREASNYVVTQLIEKPAANTVVSFLDTAYINSVLQAVRLSDRASRKIRFFGSDAWGDNDKAIQGAEDIAVDSITIKLNSDDVESFETYLGTKSLANSGSNPWFEEYYQEMLQCYTSAGNNPRGYSRQCPTTPQPVTIQDSYQHDPGVVYVMNAVYAAAYGLHKTLQDYCGPNYASVCQAYRKNVLRHQDLAKNLDTVQFVDPVNNTFEFKQREGVASYRFNNIVQGTFNGANYDQIGIYDGAVTLTSEYKSVWKSGCDREDACAECPTIRDAGVRYQFLDSSINLPQDTTTVVAFFDIHKQGVDPYRCGHLNMDGFQQYLAFLYTIRNNPLNFNILNDPIINGVNQKGIRFLIIDTCSNSLRVDQDLYGLLQGSGLCNTNFNTNGNLINLQTIGSVLTAGSGNTLAASRLLELPGVMYVSPDALTPVLDNLPHLARSVTPISGKMRALASLLKAMGWTYVDILFEERGDQQWERFLYYSREYSICRAGGGVINADASNADFEAVLSRLSGQKGSRGVVLSGGEVYVRRVLKAALSYGVAQDYTWLIATDWVITEADLISLQPSKYQIRIVTVKSLMHKIESFHDDFLANLVYDINNQERNNHGIPRAWFEEFYQLIHDCTLTTAQTPVNLNKPQCKLNERIDSDVEQNKYAINTIAASYAIVGGLNSTLSGLAAGSRLDNIITRELIRQNILSSKWDFRLGGNSNLPFKFNDQQWWDTGFEVWLWTVNGTVSKQKLWEGILELTPQQLVALQSQVAVQSRCEDLVNSCGCSFDLVYQAQALVAEEPTSFVRNFYSYSSDGSKEYEWPVWALPVSVLTGIGILVAVILLLILLTAYPHRGGTSVLGYMAIVGIIGIYCINFAFFLSASDAICGIRRFLMGVVYMVTFAPLLIKTVDNWRFSHVDYADQRYSGISSAPLLFLTSCGLVLFQCIIPIMWLILVHPTATHRSDPLTNLHDTWWCDPVDEYDLGLVLSFSFVAFIILVTSIFSAMAYDTDRNNYESRWILFACIVTTGCLMVWMVVSTNAGAHIRDPAVAIANFVNATLLLLILPMRKTVLLCQALRDKQEEKDVMEVVGPGYENFSHAYDNRNLELNEYDNDYVES